MALNRFVVKCEKKEISSGNSREFISGYWINNSSSRHIICLRILGEQIMANHVYFTIMIEGVTDEQWSEGVKIVKGTRNDYDGNPYEYEDWDYIENQPFMANVEKTFDKDGELENSYDWYCNEVGAKWCHIDEMQDCYISGYSAWRQPHELVLNILSFYANKYDTEVSAIMTYEDEFRNFLGKQYYGTEQDHGWNAYEGEYAETDGDELVQQFEDKFGIDTSKEDFDWYAEVEVEGEMIYPNEELDEIVDIFWGNC